MLLPEVTRELCTRQGVDLQADALRLYGGHGPGGDRCMNPRNHDELTELLGTFALWRLAGKSVGIVDGSFDIEQPNHYLYLIQCRTAVAAQRCFEMDLDWADMGDDEKRKHIESDDVVLVCTVDADEKIQQLKGDRAEKGGVVRPIYPWAVRAQRIANYTISMQNDHWQQRPVVDLVTIEGADHHSGTPLASYVDLAGYLNRFQLVDTVIMFDQEATHSNTTGKLRNVGVEPFVIKPHNTYEDPRTGRVFSSSDIIRLIRGEH